ncbi:MAG: hypothetical protein PHY54_18830 [Methylococcales bacterium]|nr:hypothetical protein [Methylococcales bacterium]
MKTINIEEAKHYFDDSAMQSLHEPISVTDEQKEIAVILSPEDFYQLLKAAKRSVSDMKPKTLVDFLDAGKAYSRFSSIEDIDSFVAGNRELWDV